MIVRLKTDGGALILMKKILLGIFIAVVLFITVWGIHYVASPLNTVEVNRETVEYFVNDKQAIIIREERVYTSETDGTLYHHTTEGSRVAKNSLISTVFGGEISRDNLNELRTIDKKIAHRRERLRESTIYRADGIDTESKIAGIIRDITPETGADDVTKIADYKEDINNLREGVEITDEDILQSLILEKEAVENRISTSKKDIVSDMSGIFTTYTDGLEEALSPSGIDNYTVEYMRELAGTEASKLSEKSVDAGNPVCKVVNNHIWYAALAVPTDEAKKHKTGEEVSLRFNSIAGQTVAGTIYRISETDENGFTLVTVRCPVYFEGAFSYRCADIDMVFESYTGCKLPVYAIRSDENGQYVIGRTGTNEYKCYCEILYTDTEQEFIIVVPTETAEHKLDKMERIITAER